MIALGLRLAVRGGRESAVRLVTTAAAVALGVALLLGTVAGIRAVEAQNGRYAWLNSGNPEVTAPGAVASPDPLLAHLRTDHHDGRAITRVDVAATGPQAPVPPGVPALPAPGEYYVSPALAELLADVPAAELTDRFPGRLVGTLGDEALPGPDALLALVGTAPESLAGRPRVAEVTTIATTSPGDCDSCPVGTSADGMALVLSVTAVALLFPVLVLIGTATRLSAARREQRFAAMRLIGATPGQVSSVAAVESGLAAVAGTAAGFALFAVLRGPLSSVPLTGERFFPADLSLGWLPALLVGLGVPLAAAGAARVALRRVRISPLGVQRRIPAPPPRAWRLLPLAAGIAELVWFLDRRPATTNGQLTAYLGGMLLIMVGLVLAGPWLTMVGARALARVTGRPATLVATRRMAADPRTAFRSVSGLTLALFVTTTAVAVMTTFVAERGAPPADVTAGRTVVADLTGGPVSVENPPVTPAATPDGLAADLHAVPGTSAVLTLRTGQLTPDLRVVPWQRTASLVSCAELAAIPELGSCPPGAEAVSVSPAFGEFGVSSWEGRVWPEAPTPAAELAVLPIEAVVVGTDGTTSAIERVRTLLAVAFPDRTPATLGEQGADSGIAQQLAGFQQLALVVVVGSLCIAGCGLAVNVVAGLTDRRRPFSLLRLAGAPLGMLRRAVVLESAVPLLVVSAVAVAAGLLAAQLFLVSQLEYSLHALGPGFYALVGGGVAASLGLVAGTLPLLGRVTGPEVAHDG